MSNKASGYEYSPLIKQSWWSEDGERMQLIVQDFLMVHSAAWLREEHGVKLRWSNQRLGVFTLNYDQIEVRDSDPLSQQCRGLILRAHDASVFGREDKPIGLTSIVARPFDRFFNHGTEACADVDFGHARFYEKIDGTLCIVHYDEGAWHVATRSVPDADVVIAGMTGLTFRGLFERVAGGKLGRGLRTDCTYLFELTAAENQVVCAYPQEQVWLLGVRETQSGVEHSPDAYEGIYPVCPHHELTIGEMMEWANARDPSQYEGLVVCDHAFRRCKVKSAAYMALAHVRDSVGKSARSMLELILLGKEDDARPMLPAYLVERMDAMKAGLTKELRRIDAAWSALHSPDRKTFALAIQGSACPGDMGALMARFSGKCSDAQSWVIAAKRDGSWPNSMLDAMLERIGVVDVAEGEA